jgi:hypothetical protein
MTQTRVVMSANRKQSEGSFDRNKAQLIGSGITEGAWPSYRG